MKVKFYVCLVLAIAFVVCFFGICGWGCVEIVQFDTNCGDYVRRAAYAKDITAAKDSLGQAISYLESNGMTEGSTGVFIETPENDIGYWYESLKSAYKTLNEISDDASLLEKSNVLMQVKESLLTPQGNLIAPKEIALFPYNALELWSFIVSGMLALIFAVSAILIYKKHYLVF